MSSNRETAAPDTVSAALRTGGEPAFDPLIREPAAWAVFLDIDGTLISTVICTR